MIPIRDINPSKNYPVVNNSLIVINVIFFLVQMAQGDEINRFIYIYGLVPARYTVPDISSHFSAPHQIFSFLSFMFLHGGLLHLLGNMWTLYIFGDNIEDRLGPFRYLIFYLLCGITSGLSHITLNLHSDVPTIGASGAIAGVMGAYFILYPKAKILTLIPIIIIPYFVEIPAFFFLGIWFLFQFISAVASQEGSGIAWWAHIGGFIFGIIFLKFFDKLPDTGLTDKARQITARKKTHSFQVIHPSGTADDSDMYGSIEITPHESMTGTQKLVNIPWGFHSRLFKVNVPPGTAEGSMLRLQGLGKIKPDGERGDLFLKVAVQGNYSIGY